MCAKESSEWEKLHHSSLRRTQKRRYISNFPDPHPNPVLLNTYNPTLNSLLPLPKAFFGDEVLNNIDTMSIIDSCYSGLATRDNNSLHRSVEVVSAVREEQSALANYSAFNSKTTTRKSTARLAYLISMKRGTGHKSFSFPELIDEMALKENEARMPQYKLIEGSTPIRVPLLPPT